MWGVKFLKTFLSSEVNNLDNLVKLITVHDSWFVKSITQIVTNYNLTKKNLTSFNKFFDTTNATLFAGIPNLIISCSSLSELTNYVDIRKLKLSLNIYKHDLLLEPKISFQFPVEKLIHSRVKFDEVKFPTFYSHFYQIFNILHLYGSKVKSIFHKPGNKLNTDILYQCISRNQLVWINDWDLYCISTTFKKMLMDLPHPLIARDIVELPMKDDLDYTLHQFQHILRHHAEFDPNYSTVLYQLLTLCDNLICNSSITNHTSLSLAKCLSYCVSQEQVLLQNKDNVKIITRLLKNLLDHWHEIKLQYRFRSVDEIVKEDRVDKDISYDLLYDITVEGDDEARVMFNTSNILNSQQGSQHQQSSPEAYSESRKPHKQSSPELYSEDNKPPLPKRPSSHHDATSTKNGPPAPPPSRQIKKASLQSNSNSTTQNTALEKQVQNYTPLQNTAQNSAPLQEEAKTPTVTPLVQLNKVKHAKALSDVSNYQPQVQYPPQKYKFERPTKRSVSTDSEASVSSSNTCVTTLSSKISMLVGSSPHKKPVIRGRKVGELAKLFEERTKGLELLQGM